MSRATAIALNEAIKAHVRSHLAQHEDGEGVVIPGELTDWTVKAEVTFTEDSGHTSAVMVEISLGEVDVTPPPTPKAVLDAIERSKQARELREQLDS